VPPSDATAARDQRRSGRTTKYRKAAERRCSSPLPSWPTVPWPAVSELLRSTPFPGPISLHIEYDPGGSTKTERYDRSMAAAERDLKFLRTQVL